MALNFSIPKDLDNLLWYQFTFLIVIAFLMMTFANGEIQLKYMDNFIGKTDYNISIPSFNVSYSVEDINQRNIGQLIKYKNDLIKQNYRIPYIVLFIYWVVMPLIDYIYLVWFFFFRKSLTSVSYGKV
jgi:membrane protein required for beta-lactamase induction